MEECARDDEYHELLDGADIITCDGIGVALAAAAQGYGLPRRVTGVDISRAFLERSARSGVPVVVVGASPESRAEFEKRAQTLGANIQPGLSPAPGVDFDLDA